MSYKGHRLSSRGAVSVVSVGKRLTVSASRERSRNHPIVLSLPGAYSLSAATRGVKVVSSGASRFTITMPEQVFEAVLRVRE